MRTFQFSDAKSHKFWRIEVSGSAFTVTFGKVGTAGQTQTKTFPTPQAAQAAADKLIKEKTGKGYQETTYVTGDPDAEALELGLIEHRHEFARWAVYSDYLTERGDPRGEFMRIQLDLEDETLSAADRKKLKKREAQILAEHERAWLGPLAAFTVDAKEEDVWLGQERVKRLPVIHRFERGWLAALDFARFDEEMSEALATCKDARLLRELVFNIVWDEEVTGETLLECPNIRSVRSLRAGPKNEVDDQGATHFHSDSGAEQFLSALVRRTPLLEHLEVYAVNIDMSALFALPLPHLRTLTLFHPHVVFPLETLAANQSMTNLTTIRCHPHCLEHRDRAAYIGLIQLRAICRSPNLTSLSHLCLRQTDFGDEGATEIVSSGILKRLKVLDLYGGCMSDKGAKLLAACPDFKHLEFANLRRNAFTRDGVQALQGTGVQLDLREQHTDTKVDSTSYQLPRYLYDGDIE